MESKLKALKVAELKQILTKAAQPPPGKANKQELISRIIASEEALKVYNAIHGPTNDDLLSPPEEVDWAADEPAAPAPAPEVAPVEAAVPEPEETKTVPVEDLELEKRKQRAARFGIPLVENTSVKRKKEAEGVDTEEAEKRRKRAERFGLQTVPS